MQNAFFADYIPVLARTSFIPLTEPDTVFIASPESKGGITEFILSACLPLFV